MSSKIIEDLTHIPNIIASLGLSIAEAQRHFDLDYLQSLERLLVMAQALLGNRKGAGEELTPEERKQQEQFQSLLKDMLMAVAPSRYQFTETTLTVKLDLAQHLDVSAGVGLSAGIGGVAVNAALSIGYGSDYRGAAECKTVLHAIPADQATLRTLLDRAKDLSANSLSMPERSKVDSAVLLQTGRIYERITGVLPAQVTESSSTKSVADVARSSTDSKGETSP
ncbi:MAG: hypothetical protein JNM40_03210 [Myxococcales bacterium]|nr:hypothetical protein [Myxococcales bacterium]